MHEILSVSILECDRFAGDQRLGASPVRNLKYLIYSHCY
jgi:hypothetical protein